MLAVQAQDFLAGRWALGVRTRGEPTLATVDAAFGRGRLVRAWTMRGTLHIIPAGDLGWVLSLTAGRQLQQAAGRHRQLGIDPEMTDAAWRVLRPVVADGGCTRAQAFARFEGIGIDPSAQRGMHLLIALTVTGRLCLGPVAANERGTPEQRFVDAASWVGEHPRPDDPLAELFTRYIEGHGPATVRDFAWWTGLTLTDARAAAERAGARVREVDDGVYAAPRAPRASLDDRTVFALPAFDEYYISYADRTPVCAAEHLGRVGPGKNGMVLPTIITEGRVSGLWRHSAVGRGAAPELFADAEPDGVRAAIERFARFADGS